MDISVLRQRDNMAEAWHDMERLVHDTVHKTIARYGKFIERYGWDYDELFSLAIVLFVEAHHKFDETKGNGPADVAKRFALWVRYYISQNLADKIRTQTRRDVKLPRVGDDIFEDLQAPVSDELPVLDVLGKESAAVISLIMSMPQEIKETVLAEKVSPITVRTALHDFLTEAGWATWQVAACFTEIAEAISKSRI